jgi:glycosyltransferase involved in cell wall biosynthesis
LARAGSPTIAVLLPCYNEEAAIAATVAGFKAALPGANVYVYDNNSKDRTSTMAGAAAGAGAIVRSEKQQGKGNVVRRMFADVDADVYVMADGDLTYDPAAAPAMVDMLLAEQLDMVVGTRRHEEKNAYRGGHVLGNKIFTGLLAGLFGRSFSGVFEAKRYENMTSGSAFPPPWLLRMSKIIVRAFRWSSMKLRKASISSSFCRKADGRM